MLNSKSVSSSHSPNSALIAAGTFSCINVMNSSDEYSCSITLGVSACANIWQALFDSTVLTSALQKVFYKSVKPAVINAEVVLNPFCVTVTSAKLAQLVDSLAR